MNKDEMRAKIAFHRDAIEKLRKAYITLADAGIQSYSIGSRSLSRLDMSKITEEIAEHERQIANIESALQNGGKRRRAVGVVLRDW